MSREMLNCIEKIKEQLRRERGIKFTGGNGDYFEKKLHNEAVRLCKINGECQ